MTDQPNMNELKQEFTAWVATKPADETYDYQSLNSCAWAQFLDARGTPKSGPVDDLWILQWNSTMFPCVCSDGDALCAHPWTFGDLLHRLSLKQVA